MAKSPGEMSALFDARSDRPAYHSPSNFRYAPAVKNPDSIHMTTAANKSAPAEAEYTECDKAD